MASCTELYHHIIIYVVAQIKSITWINNHVTLCNTSWRNMLSRHHTLLHGARQHSIQNIICFYIKGLAEPMILTAERFRHFVDWERLRGIVRLHTCTFIHSYINDIARCIIVYSKYNHFLHSRFSRTEDSNRGTTSAFRSECQDHSAHAWTSCKTRFRLSIFRKFRWFIYLKANHKSSFNMGSHTFIMSVWSNLLEYLIAVMFVFQLLIFRKFRWLICWQIWILVDGIISFLSHTISFWVIYYLS